MPTKRSKEIGGWGERQPVSLETSDASTWTGRRYRGTMLRHGYRTLLWLPR